MKKTLILIVIAFIFSLGLRFSYVDTIKGQAQFKDNGEYIINTNDGYFFAQGAKDILSKKYVNNPDRAVFDHSSINWALSKITADIHKYFGIKLETIMFYLSGVFSSLVVIPIILIGYVIGAVEIGFIAALLSSIAWSYYNRTMFGYYDTDMLNIVFPAFLLWSLIASIVTKKSIYLIITAVELIIYGWWYPESYSVEFSFIGMLIAYVVVLFFSKKDLFVSLKSAKDYKSLEFFYIALITFMLFSISNLPFSIKVAITAILYLFYIKKEDLFKKYFWYIFAIALIVFIQTGALSPIMSRLKSYILNPEVIETGKSLHLHFLNVFTTISEASAIPFERVAQRISGSVILLALSIIGYFMLIVKYRYFILSLPLVGLGFFAYSAGLRFTIYAIVPLAFGIAYLIVFLAKLIEDNTNNRLFYYATIIVLSGAILYPNIKHMLNYNKAITPVFFENEIQTLKTLKKESNPKDYILSWWDYGYPLKFYSGLNTLVDGGIHHGPDNFPVSYLLVQPQEKSAKMARLAVEYHEKKYFQPKNSSDKNRTDVENMIIDNGYKSANKFLSEIDKIKVPHKTRDVYLYLPDRMMRIFPVVEEFSNLDIESGKSYPRSLFFVFQNYKKVGDIIYLPYRYSIDLKRGIFNYRGQRVPINKFIITAYNQQGKLLKDEQVYNISSTVNVIYMKSSGRFIILDDNMLNSTYIQLFVLDNYDKNLYKPVISTPFVKIYKLMI